LVGTASSPEGPFRYSGAAVGRFAEGGDFDLLVDQEDAAYILYTSQAEGHRMSVERLRSDYLQPLGFRANGSMSGKGPTNTSSGLFGAGFVEAPVLFHRSGVYFALFGKVSGSKRRP
jgi:hypothetical protein